MFGSTRRNGVFRPIVSELSDSPQVDLSPLKLPYTMRPKVVPRLLPRSMGAHCRKMLPSPPTRRPCLLRQRPTIHSASRPKALLFIKSGRPPTNRLNCTCTKGAATASACTSRTFPQITGSRDLPIGCNWKVFWATKEIPKWLLHPQCPHRIDRSCAAGGNDRCQSGCRQKQHHAAPDGEWVHDGSLVKQAAYPAQRDKGDGQANARAKKNRICSLTQYQPHQPDPELLQSE